MFSRRKRKLGPPDQDAVVERLLCISAVAMLAAIAAGVDEEAMDEAEAARYLAESHRWLIREGLAGALSAREKALLAQPVTEWTQRERVDATRRNESLGVLLWALSAIDDLPAYDAEFERLPSFVPLLAPTAEFRGAARLRPAEELEHARGIAELWHWRVRTRQCQERGDPRPEGADPDEIARRAAALAAATGGVPPPLEDDFPAFGKPFRVLGDAEYATISSTSAERHYALDWLTGRSSDWDAVPADA